MRRLIFGAAALLLTVAASPNPPAPVFNLNSSTSTATGGTTSRTMADRPNDVRSALDYGVKGDGSADDTAALNAVLALGERIWLPATGHVYKISGTLSLGANAALWCEPGVTIKQTAATITFSVTGSGAQIRDCTWDGQSLTGGVSATISSDHLTWIGGVVENFGSVFITGSSAHHNVIQHVSFLNGLATAIDITSNAYQNTVEDSEFQGNVGFGVRIDGGANRNLVQGNRTDGNGIELVGITYDAYDNTVANNIIRFTGDNGISLSGYRNRAIGNSVYGARYTGIYSYGTSNVVVGNTVLNSGQAHNPSSPYYDPSNTNKYAGLESNGNFGGSGQYNIIAGNFTDDDQGTPTQDYGIEIGSGYTAWATGQSITSGAYEYSGGNIYQATTSGTTGSTAPSCTIGTCSDGGVTWKYLSTSPASTREPVGVEIAGNAILRSGTSAFTDNTINHSNNLFLDGSFSLSGQNSGPNTVTGGFSKKVATNWTSSLGVTWGEMVYTNSGNILYRVINAGGTTGASQPTCSVIGTPCTTSDGIEWLPIATGPVNGHIIINSEDVRMGAPLYLPVMESTTSSIPMFAGSGSPLNKVTAPIGSIYLRSDGGTGTTFYVKESGTDATGWVAK